MANSAASWPMSSPATTAACPIGRPGGDSDLVTRLTKVELLEEALAAGPPIRLDHQPPTDKPPAGAEPALWIRMLFSCLVDADFLDTEAFMSPGKSAARGDWPPLAELKPRFDEYLVAKQADAPDSPVNTIRRQVNAACLEKARMGPGLFSLTVPTGGRKTLASLGFALEHALTHGLERIIYVVPYLSIIEQIADEFHNIFGQAVIEHHSHLEPDQEDDRHRLAAENWDGPIVVTTAVQFFESLFSHKPSRCRKLHNIVTSVVVLDEAQLLPPDFLEPIVRALDQLCRCYRTSLVLCTATQPALDPWKSPEYNFPGLADRREIIAAPEDLHRRLKRIQVYLPEDLTAPEPWADVAARAAAHESVLCVVNSRADARELTRLMPPGTIHLSALMCGQHRSQVIEDIKSRLKTDRPVRVVSTQLIECGVDLDFPVVYRALAGLDSIAQAAGRCNREGKLDRGDVFVFVPPEPPPLGHLRQAAQAAAQILARPGDDPLHPDKFKEFFRLLYWLKGRDLDKHRVWDELRSNRMEFGFRQAAQKFRIIDQAAQDSVLVRYGAGAALIERLRAVGPSRKLLRQLQRYTVNISRRDCARLLAAGGLEMSRTSRPRSTSGFMTRPTASGPTWRGAGRWRTWFNE